MSAKMRAAFNRRLTSPTSKEGIRQTLYDFQPYAAAGQTTLRFFSVPVGGNLGGATRTLGDTNMQLQGQLPSGWKFNVESIECHFFPGVNPVTSGVALAAPAFANDLWAVGKSGWLEFLIGSKPYLQEAPLLRFPPKTGLLSYPAVAVENTNTAVINQLTADYARWNGRPYILNPDLPLTENLNFGVTLNWAAPVPTVSTTAARIGIVLDGLLFRD